MPKQTSNDNFHLIAISNLRDSEHAIIRQWCKKYRTPVKPLGEHTIEELYIETLEDYYAEHPEEIEKFLKQIRAPKVSDDEFFDEYEKSVMGKHDKFYEKHKVDLSKYQEPEKGKKEEFEDQY